MKKRIVAGLLWFYALWYAMSILAQVVGLPALFAPAVGLVVGALIAWDPTHRIWTRTPAPRPATAPSLEADPA